MRIFHYLRVSLFVVLIGVAFGSMDAHAASTPSLTLSALGGNSVQVTVSGADPGAGVTLNYISNTSSSASIGLGLTNASGYLSATVNSGTYPMESSSPVSVSVDGAQSSTSYWPASGSSSGSLSLSQTVANMGAGQSTTITATNPSGALTVTANSNPGVVITTVIGNSIVLTALNVQGTANLTICDATNDCQSVAVSVLPASISSFSLSSTIANIIVGQSQTITISGLGPFSLSQNSNPNVVSATVSGNNLVLNGISVGSASLSVCQSGGQCDTVSVSSNSTSAATVSSGSAGAVSFSSGSIALSPGQTTSVSVNGGTLGQYYIAGNSSPSVASAVLGGSNLTVTGIGSGMTAVSICASGVQCGTLSVTVTGSAAVTTVTSVPPVLSSMTVSTNGAGNSFIGTGAILTLNFNVNQSVNNVRATVNDVQLSVTGSGSGPYAASYSVTGSEAVPLPVTLSFTNSTGQPGQAYLWVSNYASAAPSSVASTDASVPTTNTTTSVGCPAGFSCTVTTPTATTAAAIPSSASTPVFTEYLYAGMTPLGKTDSEVYALQQRLKADGIYSGPVTGYFGDQTKAAVEAYQTKHGLDAVGVVGPSTRALLNKGV